MMRLALIQTRDDGTHGACLASWLGEATFIAVVDPDPVTARATADKLDAPWTFNSWADLVSSPRYEFDAAVIRSTCIDGSVVALAAAEAGKHVFVESPLLLAETKSDSGLAEKCRRAGVCLMVGQPLRFMSSHVAVKKALDSKKLGDSGLVRIHHWERNWARDKASNGENRPRSWPVAERLLGEADLANWLFSGLPTEVYCVSQGCGRGESDAMRYLQMHLGFPGGGMALIDRASTLPGGPGYFSLSVIGSTGAAYADDHRNMNLLYRGANPAAMIAGVSDDPFVAQVCEFVSAIQQRRPPSVTQQDARNAWRVVDAAAESLNTGQVISLVGGQHGLAGS